MYKLYLMASDVDLHQLMSILDPSEWTTLSILDGQPALLIYVDRQERYGEIVELLHSHPEPTVRNVPVAVELHETDVMVA